MKQILEEMIVAYGSQSEGHTRAMDKIVMRAKAALRANATFHAFKPSGKWYATGRGYLNPEVFKVFTGVDRIKQILLDNDGDWPGLGGRGDDFTLVVFGDAELDYGYPFMVVRDAWR